MSYQLGIDFGTTFLAAAVRRADGPVETVPLSSAGAVVPAALHLARDGGVTVGEGALRLAGIDPGRVVRAVKRRLGDPAPIVAGGAARTAEDLSARMVRWVVDRVAEQEGGPAAGVVLAHPASWTAPVLERFAAALDGRGVAATLLAEPHAIARAHEAAGGEVGDTVAVHDLGGGRCETAVLRRDDGGWPGFVLLGRPEGLPDVGGLDLDDLLWDHVRSTVADGMPTDARTRRACTRAKEVLSTRSEVVVRVGQGELRRELRLDRATFESLITPHVARTVTALRRTLASAEFGADGPATVLLAGGSSRIPLVARLVAEELGRPVTTVDEPELVVARGAALTGAGVARSGSRVTDAVRTAARGPVSLEPVIAEPVAFKPIISKPVISERAASERMAFGRIASGSVVAEPGAPAPVPVEPVEPRPAAARPPVSEPATVRLVAPATARPEPVVCGPLVRVPERPATEPVVAEPVVAEPVVAEPVVAEPVVAELTPTDPAASDPAASDPAASDPAASDQVVSDQVVSDQLATDATVPVLALPDPAAPAAPRRVAPSRPVAVLDGSRRGSPRRSLPRLLIGAGAVAAAALVVVALFRPDGPLDPPLDPAGVAVRSTVAPVVPVPNAVPVPHAGPGAVPVPAAEAVPAQVRTTVPVRVPPLTDGTVDLPADVQSDPARSSVDTTPPAAPRVRTAREQPAPIGAAPRVPPTPAVPGV